MRIYSVVVWRLVLIMLMVVLPQAAFAQSGSEDDGEYIPLVFGDNVFSMLYPAAWIFNEELQDSLNFASQDALFDISTGSTFETGDVRVSLMFIPSAESYDRETPLLTTFAQVISDTLLEQFDGEFPPTLFPSLPEILPGSEGTNEVARLILNFGETAEGRMYFWQLTDHVYGLMNVTSAVGEIADHEPAVLIMIASSTLTIDYTIESLAAGAPQ